MPSRADRHKPRGYAPPPLRHHTHSSLPDGLPHYEFLRVLSREGDFDDLWKLVIQYDENCLPKLAESCPPPYEPVNLAEMFGGREAPLEIEIGMGKGSFLLPYAQLHPERNILGVEWTWPIALQAHQRLRKLGGLPNARILIGDAPFFLRDRLPRHVVEAFHIYFPDPWPKGGAKKRRLMQPEFLSLLRLAAKDGALLHWGTDFADYNEMTRERLLADGGFTLVTDDAPPTDGIRTQFESKYIKEGRPIYRSVWRISAA